MTRYRTVRATRRAVRCDPSASAQFAKPRNGPVRPRSPISGVVAGRTRQLTNGEARVARYEDARPLIEAGPDGGRTWTRRLRKLWRSLMRIW